MTRCVTIQQNYYLEKGKYNYNATILFVTDLIHVSNGFTDVDSNQLITPEVTVTQAGTHLLLEFGHTGDISLNVYILNELYHRLPNRLYSQEIVSDDRAYGKVC